MARHSHAIARGGVYASEERNAQHHTTVVAQGAAHIALFDSNFTATDAGLNHCYVAEEGFTTSRRLIRACTVALEGYRACGADLQVLGMQRASVDVSATVTLRGTSPVRVATTGVWYTVL